MLFVEILIGVPVAEVTLNDAVLAANVDHLGWRRVGIEVRKEGRKEGSLWASK